MGKLLLLVAVLFLAIAVLRVFAGKRRDKAPNDANKTKPSKAQTETLQALLPCPQCGVHMSAKELHAHQANHP